MNKDLDSVLYISEGNIPSKAAHTIQIMKMANAFSKKAANFELVLTKSIRFWKSFDFNILSYYGVSKFRIKKLPLSINRKIFFPQYYYNPHFAKIASYYAKLKRPDVVYTRNLTAAISCLELKLPVVLEYHGRVPQNYFSKEAFRSHNFLGCVTISDFLKSQYIHEGLEAEKITIEYDGVDCSSFKIDKSISDIRKTLGLPNDKTILSYCGHLYLFKGIPMILDIASEFPEDLFLLIGGWDHDVEQTRADCVSKGLSNVICYGHVEPNEVPQFMMASDYLLLPNSGKHDWSQTTSPLKLFEYMASGRPIIASNLPNITSVLKDGENAVIFEADSAESMKSKISYLRQHVKVCNKIVAKALEDVSYYDWEKRAERIISFIKERMEILGKRWKSLPISIFRRPKIRVLHGGGRSGIGGPVVKLARMNKFFPNCNKGFNVIYNVSGSVPAVVCDKEKRKGVKIVQHINSVFNPIYRPNYDYLNKSFKEIYRLADHIVFGSYHAKRGAELFLGKCVVPYSIIYNSVDLTHFYPQKRPENRFNILVIGHYIRHRIEPVIRSMAIISKKFSDAKLVIAGPLVKGKGIFDCSKESFRQLANELGVRSIEFLPQFCQKDAPSIYNYGDIIVHIMHMDWTPNTVIEAMACGLPVLHAGNGGVPEIVGGAGLSLNMPYDWNKIHIPDLNELADKIFELYETRKVKGERARLIAARRFDINDWATKHKELFESLL